MPDIKIISSETLSERKYKLENITVAYPGSSGTITRDIEVYQRPSGAAILLYDAERKKVLLTEQVRIPSYLNGNAEGTLTEVCAGIIDEGELPEQAVVREVEEETGYRISEIRKVYESFSSPAGIPEVIHFFIGGYSPDMKVNAGGGTDPGEDIRLVEWSFGEARQRLESGEIRDTKTIVLLQYALLNDIIA